MRRFFISLLVLIATSFALIISQVKSIEIMQEIGNGSVYDLEWLPDDQTLVIAGAKGVWLQDTHQRNIPPELIITANSGVSSLAIDNKNGLIATGHFDGSIRLWSQHDYHLITQLPPEHTGIVTSLVFSPDGSKLASVGVVPNLYGQANAQKTTILWNLETKTSNYISNIYPDYANVTLEAFFSTDSNTLVIYTAGNGCSCVFRYKIEFWNLKQNHLSWSSEGHEPLENLALSPDNRWLAIATGGLLRVLDTTNNMAERFIEGAYGEVLTFSDNGTSLILADKGYQHKDDYTITVVDTASWKVKNTSLNNSHFQKIRLNHKGNLLAGITTNQTIQLWNTEAHINLETYAGYNDSISDIDVNPDASLIAVAETSEESSERNQLHVWNLSNQTEVHAVAFPGIAIVKFSADGKWLLASNRYNHAVIWDRQTELSRSFPEVNHLDEIVNIGFSANSHQLLIAGNQDIPDINIGNFSSHFGIYKFPVPEINSLRAANYSPIDPYLALFGFSQFTITPACTGCPNYENRGVLEIINTQTLQTIASTSFNQIGGNIDHLIFSPRTPLIALWYQSRDYDCMGDGRIYLWNWQNNHLRILDTMINMGVRSLVFSPDGNMILVGTNQGTLHVIDIDSGEQIGSWHTGQQGINSLAFAPQDNLLLVGTGSGIIQVWDWSQ